MSRSDRESMSLAIAAGEEVRSTTSPNPWVGAVVVSSDGRSFAGATQPPGGSHAEIMAMKAAMTTVGPDLTGATMYTTLEPCSHHGRTAPCTDAIIDAGFIRVVIGVEDPDENVAGRGMAALRAAEIEVVVGVAEQEIRHQLRSYLHHRSTGRPFVTLKLASTLDGRTAAADGTSRWITSDEARTDVHRMRAAADGILVGAGTVRADDPTLTVRHVEGRDPKRYVLGAAPAAARVHPCTEVSGPLMAVLSTIGADGIVDLLVEGGATVAGSFHRAGLVDRYVVYIAPALMGGSDGTPMFGGEGASSMDGLWRGQVMSMVQIGPDVRIDIVAHDSSRYR